MSTWSHPWFDPWKDLTPNRPWQSTMEDWWGQFSKQQASAPVLQAFENIVSQSRSFFKLAEAVGGSGVSTDAAEDWQKGLEQIFDSLRQSFSDPGAVPNLFWQMPLANWQRTASSLSSLPGDLFSGGSVSQAFDAEGKLDQFLSAPPLGYAREWQEEYKKFTRLLADYQQIHIKYTAVFEEINRLSLAGMKARLLDRTHNSEEPISSVRELFNLWVECSEDAYGKYVLTDDYAEMHGKLVNALMALKHQAAKMMDDAASALNMPTRKEMDTVHQRQQSTRRDERILRRELAAMQTTAVSMSEQIEDLRQQLKLLAEKNSARQTAKKRARKQATTGRPAPKKKIGKKPGNTAASGQAPGTSGRS